MTYTTSNGMQAVIPAAGEGVRMHPLTLTKPKPLLEVQGKPLIQHIIEALPDTIDEVIIVVGYRGQQIVDFCGYVFCGKKITYVWQKEKTGTARALQLCKPHLKKGKFLVVAAPDDILDPSAWHEALKYDLCIIPSKSDRPEKFGVLVLAKDGSVEEFVEKPQQFISNLVNTNSMILDERIFDYEPDPHATGEFYLTTMVSKLSQDYKIFTVTAKQWIPVGTPEDIQRAEKILKTSSE